MKVFIIGGSIAGSLTAFYSSDEYDINVFEEHTSSGEPQHCSGLISSSTKKALDEIIETKDLVINKIKSAELIFDTEILRIDYEKGAYVIDRAGVDGRIAERAKEKAKFYYNKRFDFSDLSADIFVGADGPFSSTAQFFNFNKLRYVYTLKAKVSLKNEGNVVKLFYNSKYFPGFFGWFVPHNEYEGELGFGAYSINKNSFDHLLKISGAKFKHFLPSRPIPISRRNPNYKIIKNKKILLVGDAAGQLKFSSGGGLAYILKCAKYAGKYLNEPERYFQKCESLLKNEYLIHDLIRNSLSKNTKILKYFVKFANFLKIPKIIGKRGDMDYPTKTIKNLI